MRHNNKQLGHKAVMKNNNKTLKLMTNIERHNERMRHARTHIANVIGLQVVDDWKPGMPLRFRKVRQTDNGGDWRPIANPVLREHALFNALGKGLTHGEAYSD